MDNQTGKNIFYFKKCKKSFAFKILEKRNIIMGEMESNAVTTKLENNRNKKSSDITIYFRVQLSEGSLKWRWVQPSVLLN